MEYHTEDSLQNQTNTQGVEQTVLLHQTNIRLVVHCGSVLWQGRATGFIIYDSNEEESVDYVTTVTDCVVEVMEYPERMGTTKIEITSVNVSDLLRSEILSIDKLEGRDEIEE